MAAKEVAREERPELGAVIVIIEDDAGHRTPHTIHVFNLDTCPACGHKNLVLNGTVDVEATVAQLCDRIDRAAAAWREHKKPKS